MNEEKINNPPKKPRILVAPLDWGLGHATRCIPIIHSLLKRNTDVILAATGATKILLENEFPQLEILPLDGYNISYSRQGKFLLTKLLWQLPKVIRVIKKEKKWLAKTILDQNIDAVISDNRPGMHHPSLPCVYITHQLQIQTGNNITDTYIRKLHYALINKFDTCWIPDNEGEFNLAGALSHPQQLPQVNCKYLGIISRLETLQANKEYDFLLLLSGPEPQRTILEKKLIQVFDGCDYSIALVRGLPAGGEKLIVKDKKMRVVDHLPTAALNHLIMQSGTVVARAGYSSIMDLVKLQKKAILIPTPGQTEQEYLAQHLERMHLFACIKQSEISLANMQLAAQNNYKKIPGQHTHIMETAITAWLSSLR